MNTRDRPLPNALAPVTQRTAAALPAGHGRLLVWLGNNIHAEALVRQSQQLAQAAALPWTAICVDTPATLQAADEPPSLALQALHLAESLGATVHNDHAGNVLEAIIARVQREQVTIVVVGDHVPKGWLQGWAATGWAGLWMR